MGYYMNLIRHIRKQARLKKVPKELRHFYAEKAEMLIRSYRINRKDTVERTNPEWLRMVINQI